MIEFTTIQAIKTSSIPIFIYFHKPYKSNKAHSTNGCGIETPLPMGLSVEYSGSTCQLVGRLTQPSSGANYTIAAKNPAGTEKVRVPIVVNAS